MPKLKTRKSAAKRMRVSSKGKVMRRRAGVSHFLEHESSKTKTARKGVVEVSSSDMKKVAGMLPYKNS